MSLEAVVWAMRPKGITPTEQLVLIHIANFANEDRQAWPSHSLLAKRTGFSEKTILAALKGLEGKNILRRERRNRPNGSRTTDLITILPEATSPPPQTAIDGETKPQLTAVGGELRCPPDPVRNLPLESFEANASVGLADELAKAFEAYNLVAKAVGGSCAHTLNDARKRHLRARLRDCGGLNGWTLILAKVQESPFLCGQTEDKFQLTLDFLLDPTKFTRFMEGFYHRVRPARMNFQDARAAAADSARADALARLAAMEGADGPII